MSTSFKSLSDLLEKVESTKKRLEIIGQTANYLKSLNVAEIEPAVNMMIGKAFPKYSQKNLDISWSTVFHIMEDIGGAEWSRFFREGMMKTADIGSAAKLAFEQTKPKKQTQLNQKSLTIIEVRRKFEAIAQTQGSGARTRKERQATALLSQATALEAKYIVKIFTGEMRTGLSEGLMEQAIAGAFEVPLQLVQHAAMVLGDLGEVAEKLKREGIRGLNDVGFQVFRPVKLMLAQTAQSIREALMLHGGTSSFEYKYDGARVQIHKCGDEVKIYSRRLSDVTKSLSEIVEAVKKNLSADSAIVEGEVVSLDAAGYPFAFQHLMRRFKRIHDISGVAAKIPLSLYLFDILYFNGESLISETYLMRRQILAEKAGGIPLSQQIVTDQPDFAESFLQEALAVGHEGVMAKKTDSPYTPGRRGKRWLKIKVTLEPLDLVISAAEYGYGRRKGWLSNYYLAARDPATGEFRDIGKTFKGLTDSEMIDLTARLKKDAISQEGHHVTVLPKIVVEVAYNEIQQSPKYPDQMALRFALITRIRDDKTPKDASTIAQVREIYDRQFRNKGKYSIQGKQ
jgi:DNA ligase-1